jgi:UDP-glucose 4-epimerase
MKVLITGNKGFIGTHFYKTYVETFPEYQVETADLKDGKDFVSIKGEQYDLVVHFAASVSVSDSMKKPIEYLQNNFLKVDEFLQSNTVTKFVLISTCSLYPEKENVKEEDADWEFCKSVYSLSKFLAEDVVCLTGNYLIFRLSNVVGDGERDDWAVTHHFKNDDPIVVYGGEQSRDFIKVETVVSAILKAIDMNIGGTYTLASGEQTNILKLAMTYSFNRKVPLSVLPARPEEQSGTQSFDITKAKTIGLL